MNAYPAHTRPLLPAFLALRPRHCRMRSPPRPPSHRAARQRRRRKPQRPLHLQNLAYQIATAAPHVPPHLLPCTVKEERGHLHHVQLPHQRLQVVVLIAQQASEGCVSREVLGKGQNCWKDVDARRCAREGDIHHGQHLCQRGWGAEGWVGERVVEQ